MTPETRHWLEMGNRFKIDSAQSGMIHWPSTDSQMQASEWIASGIKPRHWCFHGSGLPIPENGGIDFVHWRMLTLRYYGLYQ